MLRAADAVEAAARAATSASAAARSILRRVCIGDLGREGSGRVQCCSRSRVRRPWGGERAPRIAPELKPAEDAKVARFGRPTCAIRATCEYELVFGRHRI